MNKKLKRRIRWSVFTFAFLGLLGAPTILFSQVQMTPIKAIPKVLGKVIDKNKSPISGAIISVKGNPKIATTSNNTGEFLLSPEKEGETLLITILGYKAQEITLTNDTKLPLIVTLEESADQIEEVVVTGYGNRQKSTFTGNASTFNKEDLERVGNRNVLQSLQNLDPSFILAENLNLGSNPNGLPDILLRGKSALDDVRGDYAGNPNQPLFLIDGFEASLQRVYDLDMNRIASVTILKDAAAKAIYGAKAANGVVVIETIVPAEGAMRVSYNGNFNVEAPDLSSYNLTNASEKLEIERIAGRYTSANPVTQQFLNEQYNALLKNVVEGVDTYWLSQPLRTGIASKHTLFLEGGNPALRYGIDFTHNKVAGVMKGSDRTNNSGSINLSYRNGKILFRNILNVTFNRADNSPYGMFSEYSVLNPYFKPHDDNGNVTKLLGTFQTTPRSTMSYFFNPLYNAELGTKDFSKYTEVTENFYTEYQHSPNLRFTARVGYTYNGNTAERFLPGDHTNFATWGGEDFYRRGSYRITDGESSTLSSDVFVNWTKKWKKHIVFANGGANLAAFLTQSHGMSAEGFLNNRVDFISFARQYTQGTVPFGSETIQREIGLIGFANYSYDDRFLVDISIRRNASSVFGSDSRWGTFWSAGLGWNLHNEPFFRNQEFIDLLRIRGSIGSTGSQNFNPYQAMATYNFFNSSTYDNISGAYLYSLANDNLKWQQTVDQNVGIDIRLFKRWNMQFNYFVNNTNNLLIDFTLPPSTGFYSYKENIGSLQNRGFEATTSYLAYSNPEQQSFLSFTAAFMGNQNKITKIADALRQLNEEQDNSNANLNAPKTRYEEGQSTSTIWAVPSLGIDPITGQELFQKKDGSTTYVWSADDQIAVGVSDPTLRGNFGVNMEYKGWGLNATMRYILGADYYNATLVNRIENVNIANNVDKRVFENTWQQPGDVVPFKRISPTPTTTRPTDRFLQQKNELTLSSVNVYYDFKWKNLKKYHLQNLKCGVYVNEAFVFSNITIERGLDYPFARTFSFSLQTTF
ncbi:SusC/RagA family TonB-linked outer membrane protein [Sphingobacterium olei]|uniref:SusC/RagA family TonB-linked outer membrane protein n=1 Tax=Sphingobacterium olei TaxID=2571155 RepID=A0A4U0P6J0_9SPHI|nr:SusC/RagA family TonB-linked outer membrane protein [Sphingobacterium olei]TJZ63043.1 SusC/RagA family TonB-linked outer membrane protein [Sphingobacterium olei]